MEATAFVPLGALIKLLAQTGLGRWWNWRKGLSQRSRLRVCLCATVLLGLAAVLWVCLKPEVFKQTAQGTQKTAAGIYKETRSRIRGGIGVLVAQDAATGRPEIVLAPIVNSPAAFAGLKAGDLVTHADGQQLAGLEWQQAYALLQGPSWSSIDLTIQRRGKTNAFVVTVQRTSIKHLDRLSPVSPDSVIIRGTAKRLYKL